MLPNGWLNIHSNIYFHWMYIQPREKGFPFKGRWFLLKGEHSYIRGILDWFGKMFSGVSAILKLRKFWTSLIYVLGLRFRCCFFIPELKACSCEENFFLCFTVFIRNILKKSLILCKFPLWFRYVVETFVLLFLLTPIFKVYFL